MSFVKKYIDYLKDNPEGYWFKRKVFGWGWTPVRWQGVLVILLYMLALIQIFKDVDNTSHSVSDTLIGIVAPFAALTFILIFICYKKGEKPRWQWGGR